MEAFIARHAEKVTATLSCFDRVLFKGYLPIRTPEAMGHFLYGQGLLLKDFKSFVTKASEKIKQHAGDLAGKAGRPFVHFRGKVNDKEARAREIAERDGITRGLVCVFSIVEQAQSFKLRYGSQRPRLVKDFPRCLCLYFYYMDRDLGLIHIRLQTWFPFVLQVYVNGHDWLARKLDKHSLGYQRLDNAFIELEDPLRTQRFADRFSRLNWPRLLNRLARRVNPHMGRMLGPMEYYWVTDQAEYATDLLFRDCASLSGLYPNLLKHACVCFSAEDVMTFLGRKLHGRFAGEVRNEFRKRWPGARIKHRMKDNCIKMYDKYGCVLRVETVINHPYEFRIRRRGIRRGQPVTDWFPMAKRVSNLPRYAEVSLQANRHYLEALHGVSDPTAAYRLLDQITEPVTRNRRRYRALNPLARRDLALVEAALRGEHFLHGFQSADLARCLGKPKPRDPRQRRRHTARINRLLRLLRAHALIRKIPHTRRYRPTLRGTTFISAILYLRKEHFPQALDPAA
jgi:hypothetical protein